MFYLSLYKQQLTYKIIKALYIFNFSKRINLN